MAKIFGLVIGFLCVGMFVVMLMNSYATPTPSHPKPAATTVIASEEEHAEKRLLLRAGEVHQVPTPRQLAIRHDSASGTAQIGLRYIRNLHVITTPKGITATLSNNGCSVVCNRTQDKCLVILYQDQWLYYVAEKNRDQEEWSATGLQPATDQQLEIEFQNMCELP